MGKGSKGKRASEDQHTEWKSSWRDEYFKWLCGFANAQGGVLEIGRNDRGQVVGIDDAKRLLEELPNKLRDLLGIVADIDLLEENGKQYLRIAVEPYPVPISYRGEYHYRTGSTKQVLKGAALDRFLLGKTGRRWDGLPVPGVAVDDLDPAALERFRQRAMRSKRLGADALGEDDAGLLEKLRLTEGDYLKRAAVLLFHPDPERFVTGASVKIGYFASESDLRYHDVISGAVFSQPSKSLELLLTKYLKAGISYEGIQRIESYPMPESALREALLNAVIHRDYGVAAPIQIRVYADRLLIWNPGELPEGWSLDKLLGRHPSQPYNPDIANTFFWSGDIEAWGRGIQRVFSACREAGTPEPRIQIDGRDVWVEFPFSEAYLEQVAGEKVETSGETTQETRGTTQETTQETRGTTQETEETTQERILDLLRQEPTLTRRALAERIGITPDGIKYHLDRLREAGRVRHVGPTKKGRWEVLGEGHE
ncbi:MAG: ATP-binding protein [Planctomycetota bacterium]